MTDVEPKGPIERGDFADASSDDRDIYERGMIVFASDFTKVRDDLGLTSSAMALKVGVWVLHAYQSQGIKKFPPVKRIAARMNCSERTAREVVSELVQCGVVAWRDEVQGFASRTYAIDYGRLLHHASHPTKALQAIIDAEDAQLTTPANIAGTTDTPANIAGGAGEGRRGAMQPSQDSPANIAGQNIYHHLDHVNSSQHSGKGSAPDGDDGCSVRGNKPIDDVESKRAKFISSINGEDAWKMSAIKVCRDLGIREDQITKRIGQIANGDRFLEILKIVEWRKRKATTKTPAEVWDSKQSAGLICWLAERPEMTFQEFTTTKRTQSKGKTQWRRRNG